jgi:hypothetical protein
MPKRYPQDQRERAVRMDHLGEYDSVFAFCSAIRPKLSGSAAITTPPDVVRATISEIAREAGVSVLLFPRS